MKSLLLAKGQGIKENRQQKGKNALQVQLIDQYFIFIIVECFHIL